jgi:hypothetical protein
VSGEDKTSLGAKLEALLDEASRGDSPAGVIHASHGGVSVQAEIIDVDRLGVVVESLKVHAGAGDVAKRVDRVAATVRPAGQPLRTIEVDARLGGGVLRTTAEHMMGGRFYSVDIDSEGAELTRHRRDESGQRTREKFTLTREHLGRLVDDLSDALSD